MNTSGQFYAQSLPTKNVSATTSYVSSSIKQPQLKQSSNIKKSIERILNESKWSSSKHPPLSSNLIHQQPQQRRSFLESPQHMSYTYHSSEGKPKRRSISNLSQSPSTSCRPYSSFSGKKRDYCERDDKYFLAATKAKENREHFHRLQQPSLVNFSSEVIALRSPQFYSSQQKPVISSAITSNKNQTSGKSRQLKAVAGGDCFTIRVNTSPGKLFNATPTSADSMISSAKASLSTSKSLQTSLKSEVEPASIDPQQQQQHQLLVNNNNRDDICIHLNFSNDSILQLDESQTLINQTKTTTSLCEVIPAATSEPLTFRQSSSSHHNTPFKNEASRILDKRLSIDDNPSTETSLRELSTRYHLRDALQRQEINKLQHENAQLKAENQLLKHTIQSFSQQGVAADSETQVLLLHSHSLTSQAQCSSKQSNGLADLQAQLPIAANDKSSLELLLKSTLSQLKTPPLLPATADSIDTTATFDISSSSIIHQSPRNPLKKDQYLTNIEANISPSHSSGGGYIFGLQMNVRNFKEDLRQHKYSSSKTIAQTTEYLTKHGAPANKL